MAKYAPKYKRNISDEKVLTLSALNEENKRATWNINFSGNYARFTVWTGVTDDKDKGRIYLSVKPSQFYAFIGLMEDVFNSPEKGKDNSVYMEFKGKGFKDKDKIITLAKLYVGKDEEGVMWVSMVKYERPRIKFRFTDDDFMLLRDRQGNELTPERVSNILTRAYIDSAKLLIASVATVEYVDSDSDRPKYNNYSGNKSNNHDEDDMF